MQQRRYRPGDVLDDYCPRERRITDHAIVAMIDDHIKQTRCVVCDAEHEYKDGKVPPQRRRKPQAALFNQVLDGLAGPQPPTRLPAQVSVEADTGGVLPDEGLADDVEAPPVEPARSAVAAPVAEALPPVAVIASQATPEHTTAPPREEGPWRRQLIRAALPRPEGQQPPQTRPAPEFTIRQPNTARGQRHGRRRGGGGFAGPSGNGHHGPARFGRSGQAGQTPGSGGGRRRRGRGGKKNN
jgi:hypothetical protein